MDIDEVFKMSWIIKPGAKNDKTAFYIYLSAFKKLNSFRFTKWKTFLRCHFFFPSLREGVVDGASSVCNVFVT